MEDKLSVYLSDKQRVNLIKKIKEKVLSLGIPEDQGCLDPDGLLQYLKTVKDLGTGSFGNVYKACLPIVKEKDGTTRCANDSYFFALKQARVSEEAFYYLLEGEYTNNRELHELYILIHITNYLVKKGICQNFPLFITEFICGKCEYKDVRKNQLIKSPCINFLLELGSGDLSSVFKNYTPSKNEFLSYLFQLMAAIHAMQTKFQMVTRDVKLLNVLFYKTESGGYFTYIVHGKKYYIKNYGILIILNDFGISFILNPVDPLFRNSHYTVRNLGHRFAMVMNGKFSPISTGISYDFTKKQKELKTIEVEQDVVPKMVEPFEVTWERSGDQFPRNNITESRSFGSNFMINRNDKVSDCEVNFTIDQKNYLHDIGITTDTLSPDFYDHPEVIPPFEFYDDTQDAIRMFTGGVRTNGGHHSGMKNFPNDYFYDLIKFIGPTDRVVYSEKPYVFSTDPSQVLAGHFIEKFFDKYTDFRQKPAGEEIAVYKIS